jgi:phospholipid/cholesterol/gamma-HCH transport system substrate-binding protein
VKTVRRVPVELAGVIAFAVFALLLTLLVGNTLAQGSSGARHHYTAMFADASGLKVGDDVRIAGVRVGQVESRELDGNLARVGFSVSDDQSVRADTEVKVSYLNLLGQRYLSLEAGTDNSQRLPNHAVIGVDHTAAALDLTALFNAFKPLFDALKPSDVNALATDIIQVMQGEGGTIRHLMSQTADLTGHLSDRDAVISRVIDNVSLVMTTMADHRGEISSIVTAMHDLVGGLADDSDQIDAALTSMDKLTGATSGLLDTSAAPLTTTVARMDTLGTSLTGHLIGIDAALKSMPVLLDSYARAMSYGSWLSIYICNVSLELPSGSVIPGTAGFYSKPCR